MVRWGGGVARWVTCMSMGLGFLAPVGLVRAQPDASTPKMDEARVRAVLEEARVPDYFYDFACFRRSPRIPELLVVAGRDGETGSCYLLGTILGEAYAERHANSGPALSAAGFAEASPEERRELVEHWLELTVFANQPRVRQPTPHFGRVDTPRFQPPRVEEVEGGGLRVSSWLRRSRRKSAPDQVRYRYCVWEVSPAGDVEARSNAVEFWIVEPSQ